MEHEPNARSLEQVPTPAERLGNRVNSFIDALQKAGKDSVSPGSMDRMYGAARRMVKAVSYTALTMSLAATMNHARTRYEITETASAEGGVVYEHEDERTTQIMRFLTGAGELPPEDRTMFIREAVRAEFGTYNAEIEASLPGIPEDFESLDEAALRTLLLTRFEAVEEHMKKIFPEHRSGGRGRRVYSSDRVEEIFKEAVESPMENDPEYAQLIWELQQRVGAPRIRWAAEGEDGLASFMAHHAGDGNSFYNPVTNTVYLAPHYSINALASEDAHSLQFNERPILSYAHGISSYASTVMLALSGKGTLSISHQGQYQHPGSFEHEAHSVIEPQLIKDIQEEEDRIDVLRGEQ
ncbi:MAG: hypothetical protein V4682_00580 [Patescibacteria group bacterium]